MISKAIKGAYFMSVLSPDYVPFMSLMLDSKGKTMGAAWVASGNLKALMPPSDSDFIEGEIVKSPI